MNIITFVQYCIYSKMYNSLNAKVSSKEIEQEQNKCPFPHLTSVGECRKAKTNHNTKKIK